MSWTDERINTLKKMWKEGKSAAEIAKTLGKGVTRNAVIGKAHRMGLSGRPSPIKKQATAKKEPAKKSTVTKVTRGKKTAAVASKTKNNPQATPPEELKVFEKEVVPPGGGIALIDLNERMCKWPIGDPKEPDFIFCGLTIRPGMPYCPEHAAMAYQTSSRRGAARVVAVDKEVDVEVADDDDDEDDIIATDDDDDDDVETVA